MSSLNFDLFQSTPLQTNPFDYLIVPGFVKAEALDAINADFPALDKPGSFPSHTLKYGPAFEALLDEMQGPEMAAAFADKFGAEITEKPTMVTVRGWCRPTDGKIHTDSKDKVITVLLYLNEDWSDDGGRLRLLKGPESLDDYVAEVPPVAGTIVAFRCTPDAWHGHNSFSGQRRTIQLNWVSGQMYVRREKIRHSVSAFFKQFKRAKAA
ncbi:MAG: 2OG-Fe(II) oxygenase [Pseudomonadota bacterium]